MFRGETFKFDQGKVDFAKMPGGLLVDLGNCVLVLFCEAVVVDKIGSPVCTGSLLFKHIGLHMNTSTKTEQRACAQCASCSGRGRSMEASMEFQWKKGCPMDPK